MTTTELKKKLIDKIKKTENNLLLEDALDYLILTKMPKSINLATIKREPLKKGKMNLERAFLDNDQANQAIDKWLSQ